MASCPQAAPEQHADPMALGGADAAVEEAPASPPGEAPGCVSPDSPARSAEGVDVAEPGAEAVAQGTGGGGGGAWPRQAGGAGLLVDTEGGAGEGRPLGAVLAGSPRAASAAVVVNTESQQDDTTTDTDFGTQRHASSSTSEDPPPYVGLVNLGSTCYLNSLIQCLYHIPLFRGAVYAMKSDVDNSMACALQLLFYTMTNHAAPASTKRLTDSFGWKTEELATQQDLHEMCIKLREKLEEKMKGTPSEGSLKNMFHGLVDNVVQTLDGEYESVTRDSFYELQLTIQGKRDISDALTELCKPERLDGANKYKVEIEGEEATYKDADKFIRYRMFPPVLNLHLKRFEIDYYSETLEQRKLYDRFEYPEMLDLTEFEIPLDEEEAKQHEGNPLYDRNSRAIYRAHSVIVHSGGPRVGHYYAFIRPEVGSVPDTKNWVLFDDASVSHAAEDSVFEASFGGKTWTNMWGVEQVVPDTSYILMYVRESCLPQIFVEPRCEVSQGIREAFERRLAKAQEDERLKREASKLVFMHVIRESTVAEYVADTQHGLFTFPATYGGLYIRRSDPLRRLRQIVQHATGIPPELQRLWGWCLFDRTRRSDPFWRTPLMEPCDDDDVPVEKRWCDFLPPNEVFSINILIEEPKVAIPYTPFFPADGVDIAQLGNACQTTVYQQQKKGLQHPASNALVEDRTFSQTCIDDQEPCWILTLPDAPVRIRKIVVRNRVDTVKFIHRFQNLNLSIHDGAMSSESLTYDYKQAHGLFNPRNTLRNPAEWVIDLTQQPPVTGDRIVIRKDNSHFPPPPPPPVSCTGPQAGASAVYEYQRQHDEEHWGYPCCVDKGAWGRNRALSLNFVQVFIDPPLPPPAVMCPTLLPCSRDQHMLVMLKAYNPQTSRLHFVGSLVVHQHELIASIEPVCQLLFEKHIPDDERTLFVVDDASDEPSSEEDEEDEEEEEEEDEEREVRGNRMLFYHEMLPRRVCTLDGSDMFRDHVTSGAVITFQLYSPHCQVTEYPRALQYYEHLADTVRVHFERYYPDESEDDSYIELELSNSMRCVDITERLAHEVDEDADHLQLRLCVQWSYSGVPEKRCDNRTLREMIKSSTGNCGYEGVFYMSYQVLTDMTVDECEAQIALRVVQSHANGAVIGCEDIVVRNKSTVRHIVDVLSALPKYPFHDEHADGLVLLEIDEHTIKQEFFSQDVVTLDPDAHYELRPLPPLLLGFPPAQQPVVHVIQFTESCHSWTGRPIAERHSSPFHFRALPDETWGGFLERMLAFLELSPGDVSGPPLHFFIVTQSDEQHRPLILEQGALEQLQQLWDSKLTMIGLKRPKPLVKHTSYVKRPGSPEKPLWIESPTKAKATLEEALERQQDGSDDAQEAEGNARCDEQGGAEGDPQTQEGTAHPEGGQCEPADAASPQRDNDSAGA